MDEFGHETSEVIILARNFFKRFSSKWEQFELLQDELKLPKHVLIKHVKTRWLTLANAAKRFLEQLPALKKYFSKIIPTKFPALMKVKTYSAILAYLKKKSVEAELLFIISVSELFISFTGFFQRDEPSIHLLYSKLVYISNLLINRSCENGLDKRTVANVFESDNLLPLDKVVIDEKVLQKLKILPECDQLQFKKQVRSHYIAACQHLLKKNNKPLLEHFRFFTPSEIKKDRSISDLIEVANNLPLNLPTDELCDEWKLLQQERSTFEQSEGQSIISFWKPFFDAKFDSGESKFPGVSKLIKACFSLSHGNARVERSFSESKGVLTPDKTRMCVRTLNSKMNIKEEVKLYNNHPENVPITRELLVMAKKAYASYAEYLAEQKKLVEAELKKKEEEKKLKKAEEERQQKLKDKKARIDKLQVSLKEVKTKIAEKRKTYDEFFAMGGKKLKKATKNKNFSDIAIAQELIGNAEKLKNEEKELTAKSDTIQVKLNTMMDALIKQSSRTTK